jgi:RHS repeat-associated protein
LRTHRELLPGAVYDYGARFYDAQSGRFTTQDRYAEKYLSITPFQYAANNPLRFIDVNGDSIVYKNESTAKYIASFTSKTIAKKNGKVVENKNYNERFAEIVQKLDDSKTIYEFSDAFTPIKGAEQGQISTDGEKVSVEFGTPDESYGSKSNLLFEETFHAYQVEKKSITINKEKKRFNMYLPEVEYEYEAKKFAVSAPSGSFSFTNPTGITAKTQIGLIKYLNPYEGRRFLSDGYTERTFNGSTPVNNIYFAPYPPKK